MSARIAKLPAPVLSALIAVQRAWPCARLVPSVDGSCLAEIPHPAGGTVRATLWTEGEGIWLSVPFGLPFGRAKYASAAALVDGLRTVMEVA